MGPFAGPTLLGPVPDPIILGLASNPKFNV